MNNFTLNENFSPSMPHWLRGYFLNHISTESDRYKKRGYDFSRYQPVDKKDYMVGLLTKEKKDLESVPLYDKLISKGFDLASATFHTVPLPTSKYDPVLSKDDPMFHNRIYFYRLVWEDSSTLLQREQVWARDINNYEIFEARGNRERLGYLPTMPGLFFNYVENICYLEDIDENKQDAEKAARRDEYKNNNSLDRRFTNGKNIQTRRFDPQSTVEINGNEYSTDKSGYIIDLANRLDSQSSDVLSNIKYAKYNRGFNSRKISKALDDIKKDILECKSMVKQYINMTFVLQDTSFRAWNTSDVFYKLQALKDWLKCVNDTVLWIIFCLNCANSEVFSNMSSWFFDPNSESKTYQEMNTLLNILDGLPFVPKRPCYPYKSFKNFIDSFKEENKDYLYATIKFL